MGRRPGAGSGHRAEPRQARSVGAARDSRHRVQVSPPTREKQAPRRGRSVPRPPGTTAAPHRGAPPPWRTPPPHPAPCSGAFVPNLRTLAPGSPALGLGPAASSLLGGAVGPPRPGAREPESAGRRDGGHPPQARPPRSPQPSRPPPCAPPTAGGSPEVCAPLRARQKPRRRRSATARPGGGIAPIARACHRFFFFFCAPWRTLCSKSSQHF